MSVVTPYRSQCVLLREMLDEDVEVNTVDSYQGREADVMVVCTVRSRALGFIDDRRRLNVAITRAKHGLVVIGHDKLLRKGESWGKWCDWAVTGPLGDLSIPASVLLSKLTTATPTLPTRPTPTLPTPPAPSPAPPAAEEAEEAAQEAARAPPAPSSPTSAPAPPQQDAL